MSFLSTGITSYGYGLKIVSSGWSFVSAVLGQMSYLVANFLPSILLLMVIIVAVVIVMVIWAVVVVVGGVSFIIKLSFMFEDNTFLSRVISIQTRSGASDVDILLGVDGDLGYPQGLFLNQKSSNEQKKSCLSVLYAPSVVQAVIVLLGIKKYRGLNSNDGGNTEDGVKIAGGVIGSSDEIENSLAINACTSFKQGLL
ncbi:hypothetical protein Tco_0316410 [Tanacetum coccineum]